MDSNSRLFAISDLHLDHSVNWQALQELPAHSNDWLILAGDICESPEQLERALEFLCGRFQGLIWVPGNHELWVRADSGFRNSPDKYMALVELCRQYGVITPEDPFPLWTGAGGEHLIAPLHLLYDYSFRPAEVRLEDAVSWAVESGVLCTDEKLIKPGHFGSIHHWCAKRIEATQQRLHKCTNGLPVILVNHFPLRYDLVRIGRIPRFSIWCGSEKTRHWHQQFSAAVVVTGHLHVRATDYRDGVRFEEVSLGYPRDWRQQHGVRRYLRQILPAPAPDSHSGGTICWY